MTDSGTTSGKRMCEECGTYQFNTIWNRRHAKFLCSDCKEKINSRNKSFT